MNGPHATRRIARVISFVLPSVTVVLCSQLSASEPRVVGGLVALEVGGQGEYGTIKGRLVWGGDAVPPAKVEVEAGKANKDPEICAKDQPIASHELEVDPKSKGVSNGYAYLVRPKGSNPALLKEALAQRPKVDMDQINCDFLPHSVAILQDQSLHMKSSDPVGHNVRLTGFNNPGINQVLAPKGELDVKLVAERLPIKVACDIHPWMHGHVMVFDHPFFAVTGTDGSFEIKGVPAGSQNLVVWQEKGGYVTSGKGRGMPVNVEAGKVSDVGEIKIAP